MIIHDTRRHLFLLLALLLMLPTLAAFSQVTTTRFPVTVTDPDGNPVASASIFIWDKNYLNYSSCWVGPVYTNSAGQAEVTLPAIYQTTDSTSNPSDNIGYLVVPPRVPGSTLTWRTGETLFYNMFNTTATADEIAVELRTGYKVSIQPKVNGVAGIRTGGSFDVRMSEVPSYFYKYATVFEGDLSSGTYEVYWPAGRQLTVWVPGDNRWYDAAWPEYYNDMHLYHQVAANDDNVLSFDHKVQPKGLLNVNQPSLITGLLEYQGNYNSSVWVGPGSGTVYLPYGRYNLRYMPNALEGETYKPAIQLIPGQEISSSPVTIDIDITGGAVTSVQVQLGVTGDVSGNAAAIGGNNTYVKIEKELGEGWYFYDQVYVDSTGLSQFMSRFSPGNYRIRVYRPDYVSSYYYLNRGVLDRTESPYKCYAYVDSVAFSVLESETTHSEIVGLPQKPALQVAVQDQLAAGLYTRPVLVRMEPDNSYAYRLSDQEYLYENGILFYPFADSTRKYVVRGDLPPVGEEPSYIKVFPPVSIEASGTTSLPDPFVVDPADFVKVTGTAYLNGKEFSGAGRLIVSPYIPGTELTWRNIGQDAMVKEFYADPGFDFHAEKGQRVDMLVEPSPDPSLGGYLALESFARYNEVLTIADLAFTHNIELSNEGSFTGKVLSNNQDLTASTVVDITLYNQTNGQMRKGKTSLTEPGVFVASGLESGNYRVSIDINGIESLTYDQRFTSQSMPLISRQLYFDKANAPTDVVTFNLDARSVGILNASVKDDAGSPLSGMKILVCPGTEVEYTNGYYNQGNPVFYCTTSSDGQIVTAAEANPQDVPLEAGYYHLFAQLPATASDTWATTGELPVEYRYELRKDYMTWIGSVKITAGVVTTHDKEMERLYKTVLEFKENATPLPFQYFTLYDDTGKHVTSVYTDEDGQCEFFARQAAYKLYYQANKDNNQQNFFIESFVNDQSLIKINFDPASLIYYSLKLQTNDTNNPVLKNCWVYMRLVDNVSLGINSPARYSVGASSNEEGLVQFGLPAPAKLLASQAFAVYPNPHYMQIPAVYPDGNSVVDDYGNQVFTQKIYKAPEPAFLPADPAETIVLNYLAPGKVVVTVANTPAGVNAANLVGVLRQHGGLMSASSSYAVPFYDPYYYPYHDPFYYQYYYPGYYSGSMFVSKLIDGKFTFDNVMVGDNYNLVVYETKTEVADHHFYYNDPYNIAYRGNGACFRHLSQAFSVASTTVERSETLPAVAELTVVTEPAGIASSPREFNISYTVNSLQTSGYMGYPAFIGYSYENPTEFPILMPVGHALRIGSNYYNSRYEGRTDENIKVPAEGLTYTLKLRERFLVRGNVAFNGTPVNGQLYFVPRGSDMSSAQQMYFANGLYERYMPVGQYIAAVIPSAGVPTFADFEVTATDTVQNFEIPAGVKISGRIQPPVGVSTEGFEVMIMRKAARTSDLFDGALLYNYPAVFGSPIYKCGANGEFEFTVESGVDYYLQPIVPAGFRPGNPVKLAVTGAMSNLVIQVTEALALRGTVNVPARIIARPLAVNTLQEQIGTIAEFSVNTRLNDQEEHEFEITGLASMPYNLEIQPIDPGLAIKQINSVFPQPVSSISRLTITLARGYRLVGQLLDPDGVPVKQANVNVNLAMDIQEDPSVTASPIIQKGLWTLTDSNGVFVFENVPEFVSAFVKTDYGFASGETTYGTSRTSPFVSQFSDTSTEMQVDLTLPVAGAILGKVIDENGSPLAGVVINAASGMNRKELLTGSDGSFTLSGLNPAANWAISLSAPGRSAAFRSNVLVNPSQTNDIGVITLASAVVMKGKIKNLELLASASFPYGMPEDMSIMPVSINGNRSIPDIHLLEGSFAQFINGIGKLHLPAVAEGEDVASLPFTFWTKPGRSHIGMILSRQHLAGYETWVTWGWQSQILVPTPEQLAFESYEHQAAIDVPEKFCTISGTIGHAVETGMVFNPADAAIALYAVDAEGKLINTVLPIGLTHPEQNRWKIENMPVGNYRAKIITRRFGSQMLSGLIKATADVESQLVLGASVRKIYGKVLADGLPLPGVRVKLVLKDLVTVTNETGVYEFYLPVGEKLVPQVEFSMPGKRTLRKGEFNGISATGITIGQVDLDFGEVTLSSDVSRFEGRAIDKTTGNPVIGAEVSMVYRESETSPVWTTGAVEYTDDNGRFVFTNMPKIATRLRARFNNYNPALFDVPAASHTQEILTGLIEMQEAAPKVFYTGYIEADSTNDAVLTLKGSFDFNRVVEKARVGFKIADEDKYSYLTFPDDIGGRITTMHFAGSIPNRPSVGASVTYDLSLIGNFELVGGALFRREFEVDPLSESGFEARLTDSSGNQSFAGLVAPPGFLDPSIESFELIVEDPNETIDPLDRLDGADDAVPEFAGTAFEFVFDRANYAAGTQFEGLFEVTLPYEDGTSLEPRWYDAENNRWSKVGIVEDSILYNHPDKGYVTFKVSHLTKFVVLKNVDGAASGMSGDLNGDNVCNLTDIAIYMAWFTKSRTTDMTIVKTTAEGLYPAGAPITVKYLPSASCEDYSGNGTLNLDDISLYMAWFMKSRTTDAGVVNTQAGTLYPSLAGVVVNFPGATVSR